MSLSLHHEPRATDGLDDFPHHLRLSTIVSIHLWVRCFHLVLTVLQKQLQGLQRDIVDICSFLTSNSLFVVFASSSLFDLSRLIFIIVLASFAILFKVLNIYDIWSNSSMFVIQSSKSRFGQSWLVITTLSGFLASRNRMPISKNCSSISNLSK